MIGKHILSPTADVVNVSVPHSSYISGTGSTRPSSFPTIAKHSTSYTSCCRLVKAQKNMPLSPSPNSAAAAPPAPPARPPPSDSRQTRSPAGFSLPLPLPLLLPILFLLLAAFIPAPPPSEQLVPLSQGLDKPGKALLLTAHPDDEVMFFAPTLMALVSAGWEVSGLCLSTGKRGDVAVAGDGSCLIRRRECGWAWRDPPARAQFGILGSGRAGRTSDGD
jgi:hypothetical protein